jgi:peptide deformylase
MSEFITINTEQNFVEQFKVEPLPLYNEDYYMLKEVMPDFDVSQLPSEVTSKLISRLKLTMKLYSGVGLSANQCGVKARIFVIGLEDFQMVCINPKITQFLGNKVKVNEGCLSSPGLYVKIPRYESVEVEYYDEKGNLVKTVLNGVTAQCFQHELDHMNGIHFTELAGEVSLMMAKKKQSKLIKTITRKK